MVLVGCSGGRWIDVGCLSVRWQDWMYAVRSCHTDIIIGCRIRNINTSTTCNSNSRRGAVANVIECK